MSTVPVLPIRPFDDKYLLDYSGEHVVYEFEMLLGVGAVYANLPVSISASSQQVLRLLPNLMVEGFGLHLRNVVDFFYHPNPKPSDVIAEDFFDTTPWSAIRPPLSATLSAARTRANKELAHLTSSRISGAPPEKAWGAAALVGEVRPLMKLFAENASKKRLSPRVSAIPT